MPQGPGRDADRDGRRAPNVRVLPSPVARPPSVKAAELIADHLRRDIARSALREGDALPPEGELIDHFGVSRPTLRSALRILESEGLVRISRGREGGSRVCHPDVEVTTRAVSLLLHLRGTKVTDFFWARSIIEPAAVAMLAEAQPKDGIEVLRSLVLEESLTPDDPTIANPAYVRFYRAITDHCGNEIVAIFGAVLQDLLLDVMSILRAGTGEPQRSAVHEDHRELVELVVRGDSAGATQHWKRHIESLATLYPELDDMRFNHLESLSVRPPRLS